MPLSPRLQATCTEIDHTSREVLCEAIVCEGVSCQINEFRVRYDHLVIGVGALANTFNIPGVKEHCCFLRQVDDAVKLRRGIGNCFERANTPSLSDAQRTQALTFVVVGAVRHS